MLKVASLVESNAIEAMIAPIVDSCGISVWMESEVSRFFCVGRLAGIWLQSRGIFFLLVQYTKKLFNYLLSVRYYCKKLY